MAKSSAKGGKKVKFAIKADPNSEVYVAGSFNDWDPKKHRLTCADGVFSALILVSPGRHEYKFVINEVWCVDPECADWAPNGLGSLNSVIVVE